MNECSGCFILISYTATIFAESGSNMAPEWSAIVVAVIQLAGTYASTLLIDRIGRKVNAKCFFHELEFQFKFLLIALAYIFIVW